MIATTHPARQPQVLFRVLAVILAALGLMVFFTILSHVETSTSDFMQDYYAAQNFINGQSIYSNLTYPNFHPPFDTLLVLPLAFFPYRVAIIVWTTISVVLYAYSFWITIRKLQMKVGLWEIIILSGLALVWYPFLVHIGLGQFNIIITACLVSAWALLRKNHPIIAGVLIGFTVLIKLFPALLGVYLLLKRRWDALLAVVLTAAVGMLLPVLVMGPTPTILYFTQVAPEDTRRFMIFPINISLNGFFSKFFVPGPWVKPAINLPEAANLLTLASMIAVLAVYLIQIIRMNRDNTHLDWAFALTMVVMLILSPVMWVETSILLILPFGIILAGIQKGEIKASLRIWVFLAFILLSLPYLPFARLLMAYYSPKPMPWYAALILTAPNVSFLLLLILVTTNINRLIEGKLPYAK